MAEQQAGAPKRCFVVMGFGRKTDYATGRVLDLDKSYRLLIKPVVEEQGIECRRADEIRHSGAIDVPMYQELLGADVVIADLSTANPNALYELGIRHALRPRTTIVVSENKLPYPFDLNHVLISGYTHLGDAIDFDEVVRFRAEFAKTLSAVLGEPKTDSPVYTFLPALRPPSSDSGYGGEPRADIGIRAQVDAVAPPAPLPAPGLPDATLAALIEDGEQALRRDDFMSAKTLFKTALRFSPQSPTGTAIAQDPYLTHRLALATYKSKQPDELSALHNAQEILKPLLPEISNDPETVGLSGAIEKRLFDEGQGDEHLGRAIRYYERGYFLRNDWYNGINYSYLLSIRADTPLDATDADRSADLVWANRIRREVLELCEQELQAVTERGKQVSLDQLNKAIRAGDLAQKFWCLATTGEALFGLGDLKGYEAARAEAEAVPHAQWMMDSFDGQISRLRRLMEKHGSLLDPRWPGISGAE